MHRLDPLDRGDINPEEPHQAVLQFYLREVEGILIDSAGYDEGTQRYHAVAELNDGQTKLDLGYGKIEPDEKHNFATFDQAAYTILTSVPDDLSFTLKVYLVGDEKAGIEQEFLGEGTFQIDGATTEITHRSTFTDKSSIRARITLQCYQ